jgi:hypothetical protein
VSAKRRLAIVMRAYSALLIGLPDFDWSVEQTTGCSKSHDGAAARAAAGSANSAEVCETPEALLRGDQRSRAS